MVMAEKIIVTNYDRDEIILMIKEAFKEELSEILAKRDKEYDYDQLLTRKEVAEMLKISLVFISKYQKEGRFPYSRLGRDIYFKKGDIIKAIEIPFKYQHRR